MLAGRSVALCMIVRDEGAVIERCIDSVRPVIDRWVICDTGSTDDTPEILHRALRGVPGNLHRHRWVDFGHNRSLLLREASGSAQLLLLLDADQTLEVVHPPVSLRPDVDAWLLRHSGNLSYAVPRLVRGDRAWRFEGVTHEYLASDGEHRAEELEGLLVHHHADGGSRGEKFTRDRSLLERALQADPDDARSTFYLAQTLRDLGEADAAIESYRRRVELGGWEEEVFYAAFQLGVLLEGSDPDRATAALLDAWERRPTRAEPLHALARLHRARGNHRAARLFAERGLAIEEPNDRLFVHRDVYRWGLRFEWAIAAYWTGDVEEALETNEQLLADPDLPAQLAHYVRANRQHCLDRLADGVRVAPGSTPLLDALAAGTRFGEIRLAVAPDWPRLNPSVAADPAGGFRAIVRTANYRIVDGRYVMLGGVRHVETINHLVELDGQLEVQRVRRLVEAEPQRHRSEVVRGFEDCRLVHVDGRWFATATARDQSEVARNQVVLLHFDDDVIRRVAVLEGPDPERHEKNWMPFLLGGELHLVYRCGPTTRVLACDVDSGALRVVVERPAPAVAASWRGGSNGLEVDGGYLFVVHDVVVMAGRRRYRHRFVLLDRDLRIAASTPTFTFAGAAVEFAAGLARHGGDLMVTYGSEDAHARLVLVPEVELRRALRPVEAPR